MPPDFIRYVLPHSTKGAGARSALGVPTGVHFGVGTGEILASMADAGSDVVGVDWRRRRSQPRHGPGAPRQPRPCPMPRRLGGGGGRGAQASSPATADTPGTCSASATACSRRVRPGHPRTGRGARARRGHRPTSSSGLNTTDGLSPYPPKQSACGHVSRQRPSWPTGRPPRSTTSRRTTPTSAGRPPTEAQLADLRTLRRKRSAAS
ncbi:MAG: hypothetical protein R2699_17640 [Acidimicrobiales bacterium]